MPLTSSQVERFYDIWFPLLRFVNRKKSVIDQKLLASNSFNPEDVAVVRDALWSDIPLLESFINENRTTLSDADIALVRSWRFKKSGTFIVAKHLKNSSIFVSGENSGNEAPDVYPVVGLVSHFSEMIEDVPAMIKTTLIPFEGQITYDSLLSGFPIIFGRNITSTVNRDYQNAKKRGTLITSLTESQLALVH